MMVTNDGMCFCLFDVLTESDAYRCGICRLLVFLELYDITDNDAMPILPAHVTIIRTSLDQWR